MEVAHKVIQATKNRTNARPVIPIPSKTSVKTIAPMRLAMTVATAYTKKPMMGTPPRTKKVDRATNLIGF